MKAFGLLAAAVVVFNAMSSATPAKLREAGFETGGLEAWTTFGENWRVFRGDDAFEGLYGVVNDVQPADTDEWRGIFQNVPVEGGRSYSFEVYIRAANVQEAEAWLEVQWLDAKGVAISQLHSPTVKADQRYTRSALDNVTAPKDAVAASVRGIVHAPVKPTLETSYLIFDGFAMTPGTFPREPATAHKSGLATE